MTCGIDWLPGFTWMQTTKTTGLKGSLPREGVVAPAIPADACGRLMRRA
jgi:hypothetical protein